DVARAVDREITAAPSIDVVSGDGRLNVPLGFHLDSSRTSKSQTHIESAQRTCKPASKKFSCQLIHNERTLFIRQGGSSSLLLDAKKKCAFGGTHLTSRDGACDPPAPAACF